MKIIKKGIEELMQENQKYKEVIDKAIEYIESNDIEVLKYHDIPSETTSYEIVTIDLLKILKGGENDVVFDGFMSSGSTGVACKHLNRNFIGIELDEKYFNIAKERIESGE